MSPDDKWGSWQAHIREKIRTEGQWVGLADENWEPICDLPAVIEMNGGGTRLSAAELTVKLPAVSGGVAHLVVDELVAGDLGVFSEDGRLVPNMRAARNIILDRGNGFRQAYFITHTLAEGGADAPSVITVFGQDLLGLLAATPCPSVPRKWGNEPMRSWEQDAGGKYSKPRFYGAVEMADELDGYTMHGPAVQVIKTLVQDSIDAICRQMGWAQPHMVVDWAVGGQSPEVLIQVNDQMLWEAIAEPARLAGVTVTAHLWWPGDDPIQVRTTGGQTTVMEFPHPVCVIRVEA